MTDLVSVLPTFPTHEWTHLIPSLERNLITTTDLITLDAVDIAKRAQLPLLDLKRLCNAVLQELQGSLGLGAHSWQNGSAKVSSTPLRGSGIDVVESWQTISTLDDASDTALGGGIPAGYVTEITGESGAGKTQFLLGLLLAVQLPAPHGLSKAALYISTESPLPTQRLSQMLRTNPILLAAKQRPALDKVISIVTPDLESQDHILRYQVPVAIKRHNIGLIVLDSVAANYRAEFERPGANKNGAHMAQRSAELVRLGQLLRDLARSEGIAIVVANQVSDRFERPDMIHVPSSDPNNAAFEPLMTLDHQQRWFTGWGDEPHFSCGSSVAQLKTPSLGLVWTTQIACRIALIKSPIYEDIGGDDGGNGEDTIARELILKGWRRYMKIVFAPWTAPSGEGVEGLVEFAIGSAGIAGLAKKS